MNNSVTHSNRTVSNSIQTSSETLKSDRFTEVLVGGAGQGGEKKLRLQKEKGREARGARISHQEPDSKLAQEALIMLVIIFIIKVCVVQGVMGRGEAHLSPAV